MGSASFCIGEGGVERLHASFYSYINWKKNNQS